MIKKIVVNGLDSSTSYWVLALQLFDESGTYIDMGSIIGTSTATSCQLTNCLITVDKPTYATEGKYSLEKLITYPRLNTSGEFVASANKQSTLTIILNKETAISKINYILKDSNYAVHTTKAGVKLGAYNSSDEIIKEYTLDVSADNVKGGLYLLTPELTLKTKHLIKSSNKIHTLSKDREILIYPNIQEPLSQADYEKWGMDSLIGYEDEIGKALLEMNEGRDLEDGRIVRKIINKNDFKINSLEVR